MVFHHSCQLLNKCLQLHKNKQKQSQQSTCSKKRLPDILLSHYSLFVIEMSVSKSKDISVVKKSMQTDAWSTSVKYQWCICYKVLFAHVACLSQTNCTTDCPIADNRVRTMAQGMYIFHVILQWVTSGKLTFSSKLWNVQLGTYNKSGSTSTRPSVNVI